MFWADKIAKEIIESGRFNPYWVDDMKTPSGFAHVGSLMGPIVHSIIYRALKDKGVPVTFTFVINDFDPVDGLPEHLLYTHSKYLGFPLTLAPSPDPAYENMAHLYSTDFINSFRCFGVEAQILSSWKMYHEGKFDEVIKIALDNSEKIQDIYKKISGSKKKEKGWLPFQVICQNCKKLGTTRVHGWDGKEVTYTCEPAMVKWAVGCGYTGKISPFGGNGKLPWKVDWGAHWKVIGVTIEGAGKDHASAGGSYDIAMALCEEVFKYAHPFKIPYEFVLIGGKKMSSSKGLGIKAHDLVSILPPEMGRFLFARSGIKEQTNFDPIETMAIPDLFDEYDRCWQSYIKSEDENMSRAFELSCIETPPEKKSMFLPRFRDVANYLQLPNINLQQKFQELKGAMLSEDELKILKERENYARLWIGKYAPQSYRFQMTENIPLEAQSLSALQKNYLKQVIELAEKELGPDQLQVALYNAAKDLELDTKLAFQALYLTILGRTHGPKAAWFLLQYSKDQIVDRFTKVINGQTQKHQNNDQISKINRTDLIVVDKNLLEKYPSMTIGVAVIKGVTIKKENSDLKKEIEIYLKSLKGITNEKLGTYPEIVSYRRLYKEMGVDWHSRRPSPEALLRRVAQGKDLYSVNTCVDAYNLVVMKHRVSIGAFDMDQIQFPTEVRFAQNGETIHLLGDVNPTEYKSTEVAYFDKRGGYNMDFNYRDAQRTKVSENTSNLWLNVEGVYDITPEQVQRSLDEAVEIITKYCGGKIEVCGILKTS